MLIRATTKLVRLKLKPKTLRIWTTAIGMFVRKARLRRKSRLMMFFSFFEKVLIPIFRLLPSFGKCAFLQ